MGSEDSCELGITVPRLASACSDSVRWGVPRVSILLAGFQIEFGWNGVFSDETVEQTTSLLGRAIRTVERSGQVDNQAVAVSGQGACRAEAYI